MAISEKNILLLQSRGTMYMLLCGEDRYHLVKVDEALTEECEERLMQRYPCSKQSMRELGIHFETIRKAQLSFVQFTGTTADEEISLWQGKSRRTFTLQDDTTEEVLAKTFANIKCSKTTTKTKGKELDTWRKKKQNPGIFKKMKMLRIGLIVLNVIAVIAYVLHWPMDVLWGGICVLLPIVYVVLAIKYPAYFTFLDILTRNGIYKNTVRNGIGIGNACLLTGLVLAILAFQKAYLVWYSIFIGGLIIAVLMCVAFWCLNKDARANKSFLAILFFCFFFTGIGLVGTLNEIADHRPPEVKSYILEDKYEHDRRRRGTDYYFEIRLEDGSEVDVEVSYDTYTSVEPGDVIQVARREGGLGLAYMYYVED